MSSWNDILKHISDQQLNFGNERAFVVDKTRREYIKKFSDLRERNTICYYADHINKPNENTQINFSDVHGFMSTVKGMDKNKGLDLILHTLGGDVGATEKIGNYLRELFNKDIEVFVPQIALSGGTTLACASKLIHMGKHSSLGSTDPQIGLISAYDVVTAFNKAVELNKDNDPEALIWLQLLKNYSPDFIIRCQRAIKWTSNIVEDWIKTGKMFEALDDKKMKEKAEQIADELNKKSYEKHLHEKHLGIDECIKKGLKISRIEEDQELQDALLSLHHSFIISFSGTATYKIIENQNGVGVFNQARQPNIKA